MYPMAPSSGDVYAVSWTSSDRAVLGHASADFVTSLFEVFKKSIVDDRPTFVTALDGALKTKVLSAFVNFLQLANFGDFRLLIYFSIHF